MEIIQRLLKDSLDDYIMTRNEKRSIANLVNEHNLTKKDHAFLRNYIYKLAKEYSTDCNYLSIIDWIENANKALTINNEHQKIRSKSYFSPGEDCRNGIIHFLKSAQSSLKICVFTISDNVISDEIIAAHNRNVSVKVITDNDKMNDRGSDVYHLHSLGVPVKIDNTSNHMHHKFAIRDKKELLTGSFNWTRSATLYNHENFIITDDNTLVSDFLHEFENLWTEMQSIK